ncbi:MAG: LacI family DNA-binding transcriptional regulator [Armatimonadetes bacterium]|nr:LacI family DNA-binding transcriptional regulator [Armatimonadota bacterium]
MRTRLKDVAEQLKLSPALVSRVLNGRPGVWASDETRSRIFQAAKDLNYQPSSSARALSAGKTSTVSLVYRRLPDIHYRLAYTGLVDVLSEEVQARGCNLVVANFSTQDEILAHLRSIASSHASDAVVLWGREQDTEEQAELLQSLHLPFVVKGRHETKHPDWLQVDFDHEWMMETAFDHVVSLGHERIAYLGFPHEDAFARALRNGYVGAHIRRFGCEPDPRFLCECEDELLGNEEAIERMLSLPAGQEPTGFVIGAGNYAWQALETSLARRSTFIGFDEGQAGAAGISSFFFSLMFGHAMAFQGIEMDRLAKVCCPGLLDALVSHQPHQPVVRYRPVMSPAVSLDLLSQGLELGQRPDRNGGAPV